MLAEKQNERHVIFKIIEYGMEHPYFTLNELYEHLQVDKITKDYIRNTLVSKLPFSDNLNHLLVVAKEDVTGITSHSKDNINVNLSTYTLLTNAVVQYVDYLEIIEARKTAKDANLNSMIALSVSVAALYLTIIIGLGALIFQVVDMIHHW